jgi:hypothetical protein
MIPSQQTLVQLYIKTSSIPDPNWHSDCIQEIKCLYLLCFISKINAIRLHWSYFEEA